MNRQLWTLCALVALLAGCQTSTEGPQVERVDFRGREDFAPAPNLRLRFAAKGEPTHGGALRDVVEDGLPAAYASLFSLEIDDPEPYVGGEFEYWTTSGQFTQSIALGQRLDPHGTQNLDGPGTWETEIDLHLIAFGLNGGISWNDLVVVDGTIGLHVQGARVDIDEIGGGAIPRSVEEELWRGGLSFGGTVGVTPIVEWFMVYARFMGHWGIDEHATWLSTVDLGAELTVFPGVAFFAAYRWTNYVAERDDPEDHKDSDYDVRLEGPTFGIQLTF